MVSPNEIDNSTIIPFDMLYFTDYGLIDLIKDKYNNPDYFDMFIPENNSKEYLVYSLTMRKERNPLSLICKDRDIMDSLYKQFMEKEYEEIIKRSPKTNVFKMVRAYKDLGKAFGMDIVCKNELEEQIIKQCNFGGVNILNDYDDKHEIYFFNNVYDSLQYVKLFRGKNLVVSYNGINIVEKEGVDFYTYPEEIVVLLSGECAIRNISLFNFDDRWKSVG